MEQARFHRERRLTVAPDLAQQDLLEELERKDEIIRALQLELNRAMSDLAGMTEAARATGRANEALRAQMTRQAKESARAEQVDQVVAHWRTHRPRASKAFGKPGSKSYGIIEKALVLMADDDTGPVGACCEAIDGLHLAPYWSYGKRYAKPGPGRELKRELQHALGDEQQIERCRRVARWATADAERTADMWRAACDWERAWCRALFGELWKPPVEPEDVVVDGIVVRP